MLLENIFSLEHIEIFLLPSPDSLFSLRISLDFPVMTVLRHRSIKGPPFLDLFVVHTLSCEVGGFSSAVLGPLADFVSLESETGGLVETRAKQTFSDSGCKKTLRKDPL